MSPGDHPPSSSAAHLATVHPLLLVGAGGAAGSLLRHGVISLPVDPSIAVLVLNVVGSLALGSITAWLQHAASPLHGVAGRARDHWSALLGLGLCGGLTTFSTHMVDVAQRLDDASAGTAVVSLIGTAVLAVLAAAVGYESIRRAVTSDDAAAT